MVFLKESITLSFNLQSKLLIKRIKSLIDFIQVITLTKNIQDILLMELFRSYMHEPEGLKK